MILFFTFTNDIEYITKNESIKAKKELNLTVLCINFCVSFVSFCGLIVLP